MKKRLLAALLAAAMVTTMAPAAFAVEDDADPNNNTQVTENVGAEDAVSTMDDGISVQATGEAVAKVGETTYTDLGSAVAVAKKKKGTVILLDDITGQSTIALSSGQSLTIDLAGHNITFASGKHFQVNKGNLTLTGTGTVTSSNAAATVYICGSPTDTADYSVVTVDEGVTVKSTNMYGIGIVGALRATSKAYGAKLVLKGKIVAPYGFTVNGTVTATTGNIPEITVTETGSIESTTEADSGALYAAAYAKYNIAGTLTGVESGVEIRAGILNIADTAKITATGDFASPAPNGNGSTVKGVAVAVSQHTTNLPITVNIEGGTMTATGANGKSLYEIDTVANESEDLVAKDVAVNITGGTFTQEVYSTNKKVGITGGTFATDVSDYCVSGYEPVQGEDGTYTVEDHRVAEINGVGYASLQKAFSAAKSGETVKLLANVTVDDTDTIAARTTITNPITLDLNGKTIIGPDNMGNNSNNFCMLIVDADTTIIDSANGGGIDAGENGGYCINIRNGATLTINAGKYYGGGSVVQVQKGTAVINGGSFDCEPYSDPRYGYKYMINCIDAAWKNGTAKVSITGGVFAHFDPADSQSEHPNGNFCAPGYKTELTNGVYVVKAGTNDAMELVDTALKTQETVDVKNALEAVSQIPNSTLADNSSVMEKLGQLDETLKSGSITVNPNNESTNVTLSEVKNAALSADTANTAGQTITITVKDDPTAKTDVAQNAVAGATDAKGLDITMTKTVENGEPTKIDKPTAPVVLTFTLPEGWKNAQIVYVDKNDQPEMVKTTVNGDKVTGVFNHFSPYILVQTEEAKNPNAYEIILTPNRTDVCAGDTLSYTISLKHTAGDGAQGMFTFVPDITSGLLTNGTFAPGTGVTAEYGPDSKTSKDKLVIRNLDLATGQTLKIGTLTYIVDAYGIDGTRVQYTGNSKGVVTNQGYSKEASVSLLNEQDVTYHLAKVTFQPFDGAATEGYAVYGTNDIYATLNALKARDDTAKVTAPVLDTATTGGTGYRVLDDKWHLSTDANQTFALSGGIKTSVTFVEKYVKLVKVTIPKNASNKDLVAITETITRKNGEDSYVDYGTNLKFKLTADAKADAGKKYVVKVKVGGGEAFAPTGPDASGTYTVEASKITGNVSFELSQEMNLTADDIGIFIDTDTTNNTTSYRNYSVYSGKRTLVLIKGDKNAKYQFKDTVAQHPTIYKTGAQYTGYHFGVLIDPTGVAMTREGMLDYLVNTLGLHIVTGTANVNPTITYNYETAGLHGGEALVDAQITRDFSELAAGNKWHWAPSDDLLLKADVITVADGNKYTQGTYTGKADGHVSTDDVNTFMYLHVGMPKINP